MLSLEEVCQRIRPADAEVMHRVWKIWDNKCIPLRSLDWLQETLVRIAGVQRTTHPSIERKLTIVMAADNGVIAEGVSQSDYHVTTQVVENMLHRRATIALMSEKAGSDFLVADMGMKERVEGVINLSQMRGTDNMARGPAMSRETAVAAIEAGADLALKKAAEGYRLLSTGEMGIGNTTSSSAVLAVLSGRAAAEVTGRGAGLSGEGLQRKIRTIEKAIALNRPDREDAVDVVSKVGGLDIAGLTGRILRGGGSGNSRGYRRIYCICGGSAGEAACSGGPGWDDRLPLFKGTGGGARIGYAWLKTGHLRQFSSWRGQRRGALVFDA